MERTQKSKRNDRSSTLRPLYVSLTTWESLLPFSNNPPEPHCSFLGMESNTPIDVEAPKARRNTLMHSGLDKMRDPEILSTCARVLQETEAVIRADPTQAFDVLYVNLPWKTIDPNYAGRLPLASLVPGDRPSGLLMWVDSPCVADATRLLDAWGFQFHSILHMTTVSPPLPREATEEEVVTGTATEDEGTEARAKGKRSSSSLRKAPTPHGWKTDGLVTSRTRQLWFATRNAAAGTGSLPFLKDVSFLRKKLSASSTCTYSKTLDATVTALSSKKKRIAQWHIFPEYDAYVDRELKTTLELLFRPTTRVLSLFASSTSRLWYTWGPNVPGYLAAPLANDTANPSSLCFLKYFASMKSATLQKYLTLINLYAVQLAKGLGNETSGSTAATTDATDVNGVSALVAGRMRDFLVDVERRCRDELPLASDRGFSAPCLIKYTDVVGFVDLDPVRQTQVLLLIAQIVQAILQKNADSNEKRKRGIKRRREADTEQQTGDKNEKVARRSRKYGIAAPVGISDQLADFMGVGRGEKVARTTVVKFINEYIGHKGLQNPQRKNEILVDPALNDLLNPPTHFGPVTYFNLCKLLGPHFVAAAAAQAAVEPVVEAAQG